MQEAGVVVSPCPAARTSQADWDFFYRCYERTYLRTRQRALPEPRLLPAHGARPCRRTGCLFIAERNGGRPLLAVWLARNDSGGHCAKGPRCHDEAGRSANVAYGRYWGALERVDCLHFEACYYQPLQWCIANGYQRFEGGAQGEHKMARALLPVKTRSSPLAGPSGVCRCGRRISWPARARALERYIDELEQRNPFKA